MTKKVRYLKKDMLKDLSRKAVNTKIDKKFIDKLPNDILMPIVRSMTHNDYFTRCWICYSEQGHEFTLDISYSDFNNLPYVEGEK